MRQGKRQMVYARGAVSEVVGRECGRACRWGGACKEGHSGHGGEEPAGEHAWEAGCQEKARRAMSHEVHAQANEEEHIASCCHEVVELHE